MVSTLTHLKYQFNLDLVWQTWVASCVIAYAHWPPLHSMQADFLMSTDSSYITISTLNWGIRLKKIICAIYSAWRVKSRMQVCINNHCESFASFPTRSRFKSLFGRHVIIYGFIRFSISTGAKNFDYVVYKEAYAQSIPGRHYSCLLRYLSERTFVRWSVCSSNNPPHQKGALAKDGPRECGECIGKLQPFGWCCMVAGVFSKDARLRVCMRLPGLDKCSDAPHRPVGCYGPTGQGAFVRHYRRVSCQINKLLPCMLGLLIEGERVVGCLLGYYITILLDPK